MGALHTGEFWADGTQGTLVLVGAGPGCWAVFCASQEYRDGAPDPLDRWSKRVVGAAADRFHATTCFPSDGPPYPPFIDWALRTGRFFTSPTGMMVHDTAGLLISIRGALMVTEQWQLPESSAANPCLTCPDRPCVSACPVGALSDGHPYDVPACKSYLDTGPGQDCMSQGCKARNACPVSQRFGRTRAKSAFHMTAFKR